MAEGGRNPDETPAIKHVTSSQEHKQIINVNVTGAVNSTAGTVYAVGVNYGGLHIHQDRREAILESTKFRITDFTEGVVRVSAVDKLLKILNSGRTWITITGSAGDGKTTLAYLVLKELVDKMKMYVIETPEDYRQISQIRENRVILLNDIFGAFDIDQSSIKKWTGVIADIFDFQMKRPDFVTQVLFVSRKNVIQQVKVHLEHYGGNITEEEGLFDLSQVEETGERLQILNHHLAKKDIRVSDSDKEKVAELESPHGFPHSCEMFADLVSKGHDINIVKFFKTPLTFLDKTTKLLFETECTDLFFSLVKNGGEFDPNSVENDKERRTLRRVASHQEGSYLRKNQRGSWEFGHPSIYESVLSVVAEEDPLFLAKYASLSVIRQKVRFKEFGNVPITCHILLDPKEPKVVDYLAERFVDQLKKGDYDVFTFRFGTNGAFCEKLITKLTKDEHGSPGLINIPDDCEDTMLHRACLWFNYNAMKTLLNHGADPNNVDLWGRSILSWLCSQKCANHIQMFHLLINGGADVNLVDLEGKSPLHILCGNESSSEEILQLLFKSGADVNSSDEDGKTPIFALCENESVSVERLQFMINHGADVTKLDRTGNTVLHSLFNTKKLSEADLLEMMKLLIGRGTDVHRRNYMTRQTPIDLLQRYYPEYHKAIKLLENACVQI